MDSNLARIVAEFRQMRSDIRLVANAFVPHRPGLNDGRRLAPAYSPEELFEIMCGLPAGFDEQRRLLLARIRDHFAEIGMDPIDRWLDDALAAMGRVPRERFVPPEAAAFAYLPMSGDIGHGQTISHPYLAAAMTWATRIEAGAVVLDVGTGSGYQAAVLAQLARKVVSVEIVPALAAAARTRLSALGCGNVEVREGDAALPGADDGPYDAIVVAARASVVPQPLLGQLAPGARMVVPVGREGSEELILVERTTTGWIRTSLGRARFVPLTGRGVA